MTKEELEMRRLVRESDVIDKTDGTELAKAFNHLWEKYIEQEPCDEYGNYKYPGDIELTEPNTATSIPCGDAISFEAVKNTMFMVQRTAFISDNEFHRTMDLLMRLPSVNPQEPKTGHWIRWYEQKEYDGYIDNIPHCKCSECGEEYDPHSSQFIKYCNECGARMSES